MTREPPHDADAERALVGAAILDPTVPARVNINAADFYRPAHEIMWKALVTLNGDTPDRARGLLDLIRENKDLTRIGGGAYIIACVEAGAIPSAAEQYARVVEQTARKRHILEALARAEQRVAGVAPR